MRSALRRKDPVTSAAVGDWCDKSANASATPPDSVVGPPPVSGRSKQLQARTDLKRTGRRSRSETAVDVGLEVARRPCPVPSRRSSTPSSRRPTKLRPTPTSPYVEHTRWTAMTGQSRKACFSRTRVGALRAPASGSIAAHGLRRRHRARGKTADRRRSMRSVEPITASTWGSDALVQRAREDGEELRDGVLAPASRPPNTPESAPRKMQNGKSETTNENRDRAGHSEAGVLVNADTGPRTISHALHERSALRGDAILLRIREEPSVSRQP